MTGARWPAATLSRDSNKPIDGAVCAVMWPTLTLAGRERWFDELYVWTEGFQASTMQRARIQLASLYRAFHLLERERVRRIGVTLSFGTIERCLDLVTDAFDLHQLYAHRVNVLLRGSLERVRSPYRVRSFVNWLREQRVPIGYRLTAGRISMEMRAIDFVRPGFAKLPAPNSLRLEYWQDVALEARAAGLRSDWLIIAGIETPQQKALATDAGFAFAQGQAVHEPYEPPDAGSDFEFTLSPTGSASVLV
jgi:hypothetical protein